MQVVRYGTASDRCDTFRRRVCGCGEARDREVLEARGERATDSAGRIQGGLGKRLMFRRAFFPLMLRPAEECPQLVASLPAYRTLAAVTQSRPVRRLEPTLTLHAAFLLRAYK